MTLPPSPQDIAVADVAIGSRRSVRHLRPTPVPPGVVEPVVRLSVAGSTRLRS
jgi:hypothetical protein